jgi:hypothetical protein
MVGRLEEAREAYRKAGTEITPGDHVLTLDELDFYLRQYPTRATPPEVQSTLALIRTQLGQQVDALNRQAVQTGDKTGG